MAQMFWLRLICNLLGKNKCLAWKFTILLKNNLPMKNPFKKKLVILSTFFLHSLGLLVAFFEKKNQLPFHLPFHLLRFFVWWSVHASILAVLAGGVLLWEERKLKTTWLSQFVLLSATLFNLVTFLFCLGSLLFGTLKWKNSLFLNLNSITWHFIAPPLTIFCFYFWGKINLLRKKLIQSILCSFIWPFSYFFYVCLLSWLNNPSCQIGLYLKKYPYQIFQFLAQNQILLWLVWLPVAFLVVFACFWLLLWTKIEIEKKFNKYVVHE